MRNRCPICGGVDEERVKELSKNIEKLYGSIPATEWQKLMQEMKDLQKRAYCIDDDTLDEQLWSEWSKDGTVIIHLIAKCGNCGFEKQWNVKESEDGKD